MRAPIAKIRINAGNPGWYDSLTNIHLTITRPEALVYEGSNTTNIKRAVSFGLVHVTEGSLEEEVKVEESKPVAKQVVREVAPQVEVKTEEVATEETVVEEVKEETTETVETVEETKEVEEAKEEKPKAKKTTKKKSTKKDVE
jgi:hypothetical protein